MRTGFHPDTHFFPAHLELAVELLRFLPVSQFPFVPLTRVRIDKRNLLEARVKLVVLKPTIRLGRKEPNDDHYRSRFPPRVSANCFGGYRDRRVPREATSTS